MKNACLSQGFRYQIAPYVRDGRARTIERRAATRTNIHNRQIIPFESTGTARGSLSEGAAAAGLREKLSEPKGCPFRISKLVMIPFATPSDARFADAVSPVLIQFWRSCCAIKLGSSARCSGGGARSLSGTVPMVRQKQVNGPYVFFGYPPPSTAVYAPSGRTPNRLNSPSAFRSNVPGVVIESPRV
jgi:hypothetical protein